MTDAPLWRDRNLNNDVGYETTVEITENGKAPKPRASAHHFYIAFFSSSVKR